MKTVKLEVEEKLTYRREVIVEIPDDMDESKLEDVLDRAQREEYFDDFMYHLKEYGIEATNGWDNDLSSPNFGEVECDGYDFLEDGDEESA